MNEQSKSQLATGQGRNAVVPERSHTNIFDQIKQPGNASSADSVQKPELIATTLQKLAETMTAMKRGLDSLQQGAADQSEAGPSKRARESPERDVISNCTSDNDEMINQYLDDCNKEVPTGSPSDWIDVDDFFEVSEETGDALSSELAELTNKVLRSKPKEEKIKQLAAKHKRPSNIPNLQVQKVDDQLWRQLKSDTKTIDYSMQKTQSSICQAIVPILKLMDKMKTESVSTEVRELVGDTFKILAQTVVQTNEARKERIKRDLLPAYRKVCNNPSSATKLFGDKLQEDIKMLKESKTNLTALQRKPFLEKRGGRQKYNAFPSYNNRNNRSHYQSKPYRHQNKNHQMRGQQMMKKGKITKN